MVGKSSGIFAVCYFIPCAIKFDCITTLNTVVMYAILDKAISIPQNCGVSTTDSNNISAQM